ncbi:MAG: zinc ribbon domain-containing protein [Gemmatimonadota bacterium]
MDDLDRLAFRLVRVIRQRYPQLRDNGFSLADLEGVLLPYRDARREMADGGAEAFEITMLRLISGERGYVGTDEELRDACRSTLGLPSPTMALVRGWATSLLTLGPAALSVGTERLSGAFEAVAEADAVARTRTTGSRAVAGSAGTDPKAATPLPASRPVAHQGCRYCGGRLPEGRKHTFCPHCGLDLTKRQCPACSTQLEIDWRFCVTCGRSAELPDFPVPATAAIPRAS